MSLTAREIIALTRPEKFAEIYSSCSRKIRNLLEGQFARKVKPRGKMVSLKSRRDRLAEASAVQEGLVELGDDKMADEILKTWLYTKRPMLKATLDFFGIPNEEGITEQELDPIEQATAEKLAELVSGLTGLGFSAEDAAIYLACIQAQNAAQVEPLAPFLTLPSDD